MNQHDVLPPPAADASARVAAARVVSQAVYAAFYGLQTRPFNQTPDPSFLYLTAAHREALAQLVYGVEQSKGFIVLTGEVGTGKTTLIQVLLTRLRPGTAVAVVSNSAVSFDELMEDMLAEFGLPAQPTRLARLRALRDFLVERRSVPGGCVLIVDEAQHLDVPTLEHVRLLSNFETPTEKLMQIVLVGQPELATKLNLPALRQLRQRTGLYYTIPPLSGVETAQYIRERLRKAGAQDPGLFTEGALRRITVYAGGIPRVVNTVCDHCLLSGYVDRLRRIDRDIVERVIHYLEHQQRPPVPWSRRLFTAVRRWRSGPDMAAGRNGTPVR